MPLHPLAENFASVAEAYERGRPEYPPAAIGALVAELGLARRARVRLRDHIESFSWIAAMEDDERAELLARVETIIRAGETPRELPFHVAIGLTSPL
jgi:hypothetical protein